jgi:hypothetical protein
VLPTIPAIHGRDARRRARGYERLAKEDLIDTAVIDPREDATVRKPHVSMPRLWLRLICLRRAQKFTMPLSAEPRFDEREQCPTRAGALAIGHHTDHRDVRPDAPEIVKLHGADRDSAELRNGDAAACDARNDDVFRNPARDKREFGVLSARPANRDCSLRCCHDDEAMSQPNAIGKLCSIAYGVNSDGTIKPDSSVDCDKLRIPLMSAEVLGRTTSERRSGLDAFEDLLRDHRDGADGELLEANRGGLRPGVRGGAAQRALRSPVA